MRLLVCLATAAILCASLATPARAVICAIDDVPAATLLLPYFAVDLHDQGAVQTLFSINNASAIAVLAHVVIWSDLSVPVLDFNVYLTGYDVQTINLRDVIVRGALPQTASAAQDPDDTISPQGAFSQDITFASCNGLLPPPETLPADFVAHIQAALTGRESLVLGGCAGIDHGDDIARGYVTVDTVNNCTLRFPGDPGYFQPGGTGDASNQNVLWGDYFIDDSNISFAVGDSLVHIEAGPGVGTGPYNTYVTSPPTSTINSYTFYGRYDTPPWSAADNREPLATNFAARFINGGPFTGGTNLIVWRDSKVSQGPFTCPAITGRPFWFPLGQEGIVIFDEQEHPQVPQTFPVSPQPQNPTLVPFPAETQSTHVGGSALPVPYDFGWIYLNLNTTVAAPAVNNPLDPAAAQAFVVVEMSSAGRYAVGYRALALDSACSVVTAPTTVQLPGASHFVPSPP